MTIKSTLATLGGSLHQDAANLLKMTRGCRPDMHEPDEQGLSAKVVGRHFDNAGCDGELAVRFTLESGARDVNLATLVALARIGAQVVLDGRS